jgi:tripartite-type tricarboxylate transporter receptor subunit TctC
LRDPAVAQRLRALTFEPVGSTPEEFAKFFRSEVEKFAKVVKDAKIPMQD